MRETTSAFQNTRERTLGTATSKLSNFLQDIDDYIAGKSETPYYFGHFLFENLKSDGDNFDIIDGQQRLPTIEIFLLTLV
ncbi:GmrSD restriction endonuclease domain-containing protein [Treponema saccharophilum]|uniref:GmrSD restriction endonuclease domain-containing protein n=1 Tax=Treponema saccharophilum TaxID=165 RepID=UPI0005949C5E